MAPSEDDNWVITASALTPSAVPSEEHVGGGQVVGPGRAGPGLQGRLSLSLRTRTRTRTRAGLLSTWTSFILAFVWLRGWRHMTPPQWDNLWPDPA